MHAVTRSRFQPQAQTPVGTATSPAQGRRSARIASAIASDQSERLTEDGTADAADVAAAALLIAEPERLER
jgi:hypothetical protein